MLFDKLLCIVLFSAIQVSLAAMKGGKYCAACHVIVDEIEYDISKIDPRKVLELDGFRIDPHGNQMKRKTVPYARSETHLTEVTEALCDRMNQYALSTNKETGVEKFVLTNSRDGKPVTLENVSMSGETSEELRHMCNAIIEDTEESIIEYFKNQHPDPKTEFCTTIADLCHADDDAEDAGDEEEEEQEGEPKEEL